jgi:hypothetical protein
LILADWFPQLFKLLRFCTISFLVSVVVIEGIRVAEAQIAIDGMANLAVRYGSTGQYDLAFCDTQVVLDHTVEFLKTQNISISIDELLSIDNGNLENCRPPNQYRFAMVDAARYLTILELIRERTPTVIDARYLRIVICSDHPGFAYDSDSDTCSPHDYPGSMTRSNDPDKIFASLTYQYPLGSSLGLDILKIRLHVFHQKELESYR